MVTDPINRRGFNAGMLKVSAGVLGWTYTMGSAQSQEDSPSDALTNRVYKSVKWGMIEDRETVLEKFQLCKELGFDGMELISPAPFAADEVRKASEATGLPVHGVVNMKHWEVRLSSPDETVRKHGVEILSQAIHDAKAFAGDSVLLVPGSVKGPDENHDHVWRRSIVEIRKVLPLASRLGVRILIENVWNGFCETPEELRDYLDEIDSPWVGAYFDIGNVAKFSPSQDWIRILGSRIVKLDVKGWGKQWKESRGFCKIGDGDIDWPEVCKALEEIEFTGWATAEVNGGDRDRLSDIAARMDQVLELN